MDLFTLLVVLVVVGSRIIVPLFIPKYPLPAIIACLLIDGIDQTIFQTFTDLELTGYQSYDKALDIYYLSVAYLSTFKNWTNQFAFQVSQFLFYYRMFGLVLFENTQNRALLFIFPNTFEYFFIFVSAIALFWNMKRLSKKMVIVSAAFIWIFIKLPQEYWIHIAQLDTTDFIKETILGVPVNTSWSQAISVNLWVIPALGIVALILGIIIWKVWKKLPTLDHKLQWSPIVKEKINLMPIKATFLDKLKLNRYDLIEKLIFSGLLLLIFAHVFPSFRGTNSEIVVGVVLIIIANVAISHLLINSTKFKIDIFNKFFAMLVINSIVAFIYANFLAGDEVVHYSIILFFAYILTLITVLYDRYKPYYITRFKRLY